MNPLILQGNVIDTLKTIAAGSVRCVVTSPPYYGLRSYLKDSDPLKEHEIGTEATPELYIGKLVSVFQEVRRVLADDGTLFLNLGDSYFGSNKGMGKDGVTYVGAKQKTNRGSIGVPVNARRATSYGTSGKAQSDYQENGCLCGNLCGVCRVAYQNHRFHNDGLLVAMLAASLSETSHVHTELQSDHLPTSDYLHQQNHNVHATLDQENFSVPVDGRLRASLASMLGESFPQLLEVCLERAIRGGVCLLCARSLDGYVQASADTLLRDFEVRSQHSQGIEKRADQQMHRNQYKDKACEYCDVGFPYQDYTTTYLKPKDLMMIPARVAIALQSDGWYLRSEIVWSKPNPMPESVKDRPTRSHEMIYLLSKSEKYYYDYEAILEPAEWTSKQRWQQDVENQTRSTRANGGAKTNGNMKAVGGHLTIRQTADGHKGAFSSNGKLRAHVKNIDIPGRLAHSMHINRDNGLGEPDSHEKDGIPARNKRDVWTVATKPYSGAHFATFPPDLIEPCILAGSAVGDTVLDPFGGSGTTASVAIKHNRKAILCELNNEYIPLIKKRMRETQPLLLLAVME